MNADPLRMSRMTERREAVETIVKRHMAHWGIPAHDVNVTWNRNGSSVPIVSSGGTSGEMRNVPFDHDGMPDAEGREAIAAVCFRTIRRHLRQRSLRNAGYGEDAVPAWSIAADPMTLSCLRHYGVRVAETASSFGDLTQAIRKAGLTITGVSVDDGLLRLGELGIPDATWSITDYARMQVHVHLPVPDTMLVAIEATRPSLEEIVLLPFPVPDRRIRRVRRGSDGGIVLDLGRRLATLAPVPDGIDTGWLRVPQCQIHDIPF